MRSTRLLVLFAAALLVASALPSTPAVAQGLNIRDVLNNPGMARGLSEEEARELHRQFRALPESQRRAFLDSRRRAGFGPSRGPNPTLQYDSGVAHPFRVTSPEVVGNNFNSGFGNPHTLTTVTLQLNGNFVGAALEVFGAPVGSAAPQLLSQVIDTAPINTLTAIPLATAQTNMSGTFLIGVDQSGSSISPSTTFINVAVDINSGGFGFHGMSISAGGGGGFNPAAIVPTTSNGGGPVPFNAMVRVTGANLPVELMDVSVD